jgi:hypothetical protein
MLHYNDEATGEQWLYVREAARLFSGSARGPGGRRVGNGCGRWTERHRSAVSTLPRDDPRGLARCRGVADDVIRTRVLLVDIDHWEVVGRVHGEFFGSVRPAMTVMQVSRFIDPAWLVEIEADAVLARI